jgi:dTDP-4-dehydrorhamnose 3,5-epimerase
LEGLKLVTRRRIGDHRGFLSRLFCSEELAWAGWTKPIAQVNHTYTARPGTVRGMHFQRTNYAEMKCVNCIRGEIWDVAVDIRVNSPSFLQWHAERLSADLGTAMLIPEGFAHGFQALTEDVELIYFHSEVYTPEAEAGLNPKDPMLAIAWPMEVAELSQRDAAHPMVADSLVGMER